MSLSRELWRQRDLVIVINIHEPDTVCSDERGMRNGVFLREDLKSLNLWMNSIENSGAKEYKNNNQDELECWNV